MIFCLILAVIVFIFGTVICAFCFKDGFEDGIMAILFVGFLTVVFDFFLISPFVALDKSSGSTIGTITAVDKNFFGTYSLYLKTTENNEDVYCMENDEIINQAQELVGEKVKLYYGERVGFYHLNQCRKAPIDVIEPIEGN